MQSSFWLEAHNPGEPLNFLDHRVKCGNAIVGLAREEDLEKGVPDEALNHSPVMTKISLPHLEKPIKKNDRSGSLAGRNKWTLLPWCVAKWKRYLLLECHFKTPRKYPNGNSRKKKLIRISPRGRCRGASPSASIPVAQFYLSKTSDHRHHFITDGTFRNFLAGNSSPDQNLWIKLRNSQNEKVFSTGSWNS